MAEYFSEVRKSDLVGGIECPVCSVRGTVDFIDLVRGVSSLHCNACGVSWKMQTEASMGHLSN